MLVTWAIMNIIMLLLGPIHFPLCLEEFFTLNVGNSVNPVFDKDLNLLKALWVASVEVLGKHLVRESWSKKIGYFQLQLNLLNLSRLSPYALLSF